MIQSQAKKSPVEVKMKAMAIELDGFKNSLTSDEDRAKLDQFKSEFYQLLSSSIEPQQTRSILIEECRQKLNTLESHFQTAQLRLEEQEREVSLLTTQIKEQHQDLTRKYERELARQDSQTKLHMRQKVYKMQQQVSALRNDSSDARKFCAEEGQTLRQDIRHITERVLTKLARAVNTSAIAADLATIQTQLFSERREFQKLKMFDEQRMHDYQLHIEKLLVQVQEMKRRLKANSETTGGPKSSAVETNIKTLRYQLAEAKRNAKLSRQKFKVWWPIKDRPNVFSRLV